MAKYSDYHLKARRLVILRLLLEDTDRTVGDRAIKVGLNELGYNEALETIQEDLRWLASVNAVSIEEPRPEILIATLDRAGIAHLELSKPIDGVLRPTKRVEVGD